MKPPTCSRALFIFLKHYIQHALKERSAACRARFAAHFRDTLGITPGEYLTDWRLSITKTLLKRGQPVKHVAMDVGYGNTSALARAFAARHHGLSPTQWLAEHT